MAGSPAGKGARTSRPPAPGNSAEGDVRAPFISPEDITPPLDRKNLEVPAEPVIHSVSGLTRQVRTILEAGIGDVWVEGEISNFRRQSSGHCYFTLKDDSAQLQCVLFARTASGIRDVQLADGRQIELFGSLSVYEARGQYQLLVKRARDRGAGALHARFEALKAKLQAEGLFDASRKKPLPPFPSKIGLVTSPTGAALRDFLNVLHRRHAGIDVLINPVRVQGSGAAAEIAAAVREFSTPAAYGLPAVDVVVVTRGGGSLEDLWEFNEEAVARAVAECEVPVVSAVGHEIDFTICDFVADLRAPTPSAAAELLSTDAAALVARLRRELARMASTASAGLEIATARLRAGAALAREARRAVDQSVQRTDRATDGLTASVAAAVRDRRAIYERFRNRFDARGLVALIAHSRTKATSGFLRLNAAAAKQVAAARSRLETAAASLTALAPSATLARGFTITCGPDGLPITDAATARKAKTLRTRFGDGEVSSTVNE